MKKRTFGILVLTLLLFAFLRIYHLAKEVNFGSDQGLQLLEIHRRYTERDFTLIGPYSSFQVEGKTFFFGPLPYYLPLPWMIVFKWEALASSYFVIFLQAGALIISLWIFRRAKAGWRVLLLYVLFFCTFPQIVYYGRFFWNPNFHIPIASLLLACLYYYLKKKKDLLLVAVGVLFGLGMQPHFAFILAILASLAILLIHKISIRCWSYVLTGFLIGFSPWIWFELRHSFYNTKIMMQYFFTSTGKSFNFQEYYIVSLLPFIIFFASLAIVQGVSRWGRKKVSAIALIAILYSLILIAFRSPVGIIGHWNYEGLVSVYENIKNDHPQESYNIVDLLTGDTRAMSLRYLLTIAGIPPKEVHEYPSSTPIYLYTRVPIEEVEKGTLWELDAVRPFQVVSQWNIQNDVILYKLKKQI